MNFKKFLLLSLFLLGTVLPVWSLDVPALSGRVNDYAGFLSSGEKSQLENFLADYETKTSNQLALLTIPSLEGDALEAFSMRVVEKWKLGQKNKNNGLLILLVKDSHDIRIEVGYGLESKVTDAFSGFVIRNIMVPEFQSGNFYGGLQKAFEAITAKIADEFKADKTNTHENPITDKLGEYWIVILVVTVFLGTILQLFSSKKKPLRPGWVGMVVLPILTLLFFGPGAAVLIFLALLLGFPYGFIAIIVAQIFWALASSSGSGRSSGSGWSSSGGSSGGFSGGGGSFGGGGASGKW